MNLGNKVGNWQTFSIVWSDTYIRFLRNGAQYHEVAVGGWSTGGVQPSSTNPYAPFDVPFYLILDMAVGGLYPGYNIATSQAPFRYLVDYVRVYDILP